MMIPTVDSKRSADRVGDDATSNRREFLAQASTITLGSLTLTVLPGCGDGDTPPLDSTESPVYGFLVDAERCIGAGKCLIACRVENDVPEGCHRTWVERHVQFNDGTVQVELVPETGYTDEQDGELERDDVARAFFVPKLCNHCDDAPCHQVCPTHASYTSPEGMELIDTDLCIGCSYCVQACPYGVRFINTVTETADKCTWCYHRVMRDEEPACVEVCPVGARLFGRLDIPDSEISRRLSEVPASVLKPYLGTHPKVHYIGISDRVT